MLHAFRREFGILLTRIAIAVNLIARAVAGASCAALDIFAAGEPEPGACVCVWARSCCENKRDSASRAIPEGGP